jgi:hypothetical protein
MSEYKKEAKAASAAKMQRMGLKLEDGSKSFTDERGGSPFEGLNSGNAGKMPITPSRFKRGGKVAHVAGEKAHKNLGKAPRKAAGGSSNIPLPPPRPKNMDKVPLPPTRSIADEYKAYHPDDDKYLNSNTTGYARGGMPSGNPAARKKMAAAISYKKKGAGLSSKMNFPKISGLPNVAADTYVPRKSGGAAKHTDEAQDKKLMHKVLKQEAFKADGGSIGRRRYDKLNELDQMFAPLRKQKEEQRKRGQESSINSMEGLGSKKPIERQAPTHWPVYQENPELRKEKLKEARMYDSFKPKRGPYHEKALQEEYLDQDKNASLTSSGLKRGGRAHKMGGGAMSRYMDAARENLAANKKYKDQQLLSNLKSKMYGSSSRPYSPADIMDTERTMSKRQRGIRMAADKLSGNANVPATNDEEMNKGGRAHRATGGRTKGKTNVNIIISPQSGGQGQGVLGAGVGMGQPPVPPMMPPVPPQMPPMPPAGGMPMGGAPQLPPQLMAALAARGGAGGPPMPRKTGGRVGNVMPKYQEKDYGSGSGLGRLVKKKWPTANGTE